MTVLDAIAQNVKHMIPDQVDPKQDLPTSKADADVWTTNTGAPVWNNADSLTVGKRGPVLLEDYHLIEKLAQFDRERIPERVVHARGAAAKGYFEVTHDVSHLTCADFLRAPGTKTPLIARFSTVINERGSPETVRDPRGFSVKFYTNQGNYDIVGNNMPVFFVRDGMAFPDLIHAFKPNPKSHLQEWWRIKDFLSHHPESLHMLTFLMDDQGIPKDYRHMPGFGVHAFKWVNKDGKETFIKYHWKPSCGEEYLMDDEAEKIGGHDFNHATGDLYNNIRDGNFPEWQLFIQTMELQDEDKFDFDPLDVTIVWPEDQFPLQPVGKMVLNQNVDNFFAENESLAFSPAVIVPGIQYSDDKMLQTRLFSYSDTQRYRLGPNYLLLAVNAPRNKFHNNHHDGIMNPTQRKEEVNYFPSRFDPTKEAPKAPTISAAPVAGPREEIMIAKQNNFKQAGERYRWFDAARQERFIGREVMWLSDPRVTKEIRKIWIGYWAQADAGLGAKIQEKLAADNLL